MDALKTFVYVGADLYSPVAFPVTTHMGVRSTGVSGLRQILTLDGVNFWVVGNAAEYNGLRFWATGPSTTASTDVSGGTNPSQPGYDSAIGVAAGQDGSSVSFTAQGGLAAGGVYNVSSTSQAVALFEPFSLSLTAFSWTAKPNQFWVAYDNGPGQRGTISRFQQLATLVLQVNVTIDADSRIYSMTGNYSSEY